MTFKELVYILWLQSISGMGNVMLNRILSINTELKLKMSDVFEMGAMDITSTYRLPLKIASVIEQSKDAIHKAEDIYQRLNDCGVEIITYTDMDYPERLKKSLLNNAPAVLFIKGNKGLLQMDSVAIVGSRDCSTVGLDIAKEFAYELSKRFNIVSGYAKGVDTESHKGALLAGGYTTISLSYGILGFKIKKEFIDIWNGEHVLIISEFIPDVVWNRGFAMARNKTICGLADAIIVIEAGLSGGTMDAGLTAIKQGKSLYVSDHLSDSGNRILIDKGGTPININDLVNIKPHDRDVVSGQQSLTFRG